MPKPVSEDLVGRYTRVIDLYNSPVDIAGYINPTSIIADGESHIALISSTLELLGHGGGAILYKEQGEVRACLESPVKLDKLIKGLVYILSPVEIEEVIVNEERYKEIEKTFTFLGLVE